ncbi:MAG TPA: hypothetical protein VL588_03225, partial [Bdellovibrionota bacterium]|nr:hypothetical protein [Bdellovibrionota bacterium]
DGDIGAIMGLGFPPFLGGPFHFLDGLGSTEALSRMNRLVTACGPRFQSPPLKEHFYEVGLSH